MRVMMGMMMRMMVGVVVDDDVDADVLDDDSDGDGGHDSCALKRTAPEQFRSQGCRPDPGVGSLR